MKNLREFAQSLDLFNDPEYRERCLSRLRAGTLPPEVEALILEAADGRLPVAEPVQNPRTLALVRLPAEVSGD